MIPCRIGRTKSGSSLTTSLSSQHSSILYVHIDVWERELRCYGAQCCFYSSSRNMSTCVASQEPSFMRKLCSILHIAVKSVLLS